MGLAAYSKVRLVEVPNVNELNAILMDIQLEGRNIIDVDYNTILPNGNMVWAILYHSTPEAKEEENANNNIEETPSQGSENMGSSI